MKGIILIVTSFTNIMENSIQISRKFSIPFSEIRFRSIRASGPGGQHVNRVATGIELRVSLDTIGLPEEIEKELLNSTDRRITKAGEIVIQAGNHRSAKMNKQDAIDRLIRFLQPYFKPKKTRIPTKISKAAKVRRRKVRDKLSEKKQWRRKVEY